MTHTPGPYDAHGRPQDSVPGQGSRGNPQDSAPYRGDPLWSEPAPRGGFRAFPFPSYSTRTRRGTQVTVGGCCLPIPLGCLVTTLAVSGVAAARLMRSRR